MWNFIFVVHEKSGVSGIRLVKIYVGAHRPGQPVPLEERNLRTVPGAIPLLHPDGTAGLARVKNSGFCWAGREMADGGSFCSMRLG